MELEMDDTYSLEQRCLRLPGFHNLRDIGGYPAADGKTTRWNSILRGACPDAYDAESHLFLRNYGCRTLCDLRRPSEISRFPNPYEGKDGFVYSVLSIDTNEEVQNSLRTMNDHAAIYRLLLDKQSDNVVSVLRYIARVNDCVLVYCTAGKDRTGLIIALLLNLAGVADETVAWDYGISHKLFEKKSKEYEEYYVQAGMSRDFFQELIKSPPGAMMEFLAYLRKTWGGAEGFLEKMGVNADERESLRAKVSG